MWRRASLGTRWADPGALEEALAVRAGRPKQRLTLRLDADLIAGFKAQGQGYQASMNAVFRAYVEREAPHRWACRPVKAGSALSRAC